MDRWMDRWMDGWMDAGARIVRDRLGGLGLGSIGTRKRGRADRWKERVREKVE
jgi:hypothetical protein